FIGVVYMKNVLNAYKYIGLNTLDFRTLINEPLFVPSTIFIDDLLIEFRKKHTNMAILKDEYGGVEGIVTLEDLLEEIVGDIEDEYDEIQRLSRMVDEKNYYINGKRNLQTFYTLSNSVL